MNNILDFVKVEQVKRHEIKEKGLVFYTRNINTLERADILDVMEKSYGVKLQDLANQTEDVHVTYKGLFEFMIYVVKNVVCNEDGSKVFVGENERKVEMLEQDLLSEIGNICLSATGINDKTHKEAVKN